MKPVIFGLSGPVLTDVERAFFAEVEPAGYILFGRNVVDRAQVRALTDALRDLAGREDLAILIDQEGGPVARMRHPNGLPSRLARLLTRYMKSRRFPRSRRCGLMAMRWA